LYRIHVAWLFLTIVSAISLAAFMIPWRYGQPLDEFVYERASRALLAIWWYSAILAAMAGLVLSTIELRRSGPKRSFAIIGLMLSVVLVGIWAASWYWGS
jgi:hypothetical protein